MKLVIGDKNYSTWSWRVWLALHSWGIPFDEVVIQLNKDNTTAEILKHSPSARVPFLRDGDLGIWDSLAISEYLNEKYPQKQMWPADMKTRAWARAVVCEMHSGFSDLRKLMPGDIKKRLTGFDYSPVAKDVSRIQEIWAECRKAHAHLGPYLFGTWTLADCFYAPVVWRFVSYGVKLEGAAKEYVQTMLAHPSMKELERQALAE